MSNRWQDVERLYHEALARPAGDRAAFLQDACAGDADLEREVESLLAQASAASGFLKDAAVDAAANAMTDETRSLIGRHIGVYRVTARLGAGGMGEVYRARDTKLGREVAIKVLPAMFTADRDRLSRLEREARMLATLNHPHIGAIYGFEDSDGVRALVLELVEGATLAERLVNGPIPLNEALAIARQIAEALDAAHEKGIIHRDLKPANIKIAPDGSVKVLDFGLAKLAPTSAGTATSEELPTMSLGGSREGMILGTPAYMSPEQARGQAVDKRTDIWAFGCVLFEMLSSRSVFAGDTITDTLAAVVGREPDWRVLPPSTPPAIERLLRRCLEKDPKRRLRDVGEAQIEIVDVIAASIVVPAVVAAPSVAGARRFGLWALAAALTAVAGGAVAWNLRPAPTKETLPTIQLTLSLGPGNVLAIDPVAQDVLEISPDGMSVAYVVARHNSFALYLRELSGPSARLVAESRSSVFYPFFSPDSQWLGFAANGKLRKVPVRGGQPTVICDAANFRGASWGDDGSIVFAPVSRAGLSRVSANGGVPEVVTTVEADRGETSHRLPWVLPGGKTFLFVVEGAAGKDEDAVWSYAVGSKERRSLLQGATSPRYVPTGHLLYVQGNTLMAVRFDPVRSQLTGTPVPLVEGAGRFATSLTGSLVYASGTQAPPRRTLVWVDRHGEEAPLAIMPGGYSNPKLSPDGQDVLLQLEGPSESPGIGIYDLTRDTLRRLTFENGGGNSWAIWSADGRRITYSTNRPGTSWDIFSRPADGTGSEEPLVQKPLSQRPASWSTDGSRLAFTEESPAGISIWVLSTGDKNIRPFPSSRASAGAPVFSPDGRWLAYASTESGRFEVYVRPASGAGGKWQISTQGGLVPLWAPGGHELFFRSGETVQAVDVTSEPGFAAGKAHVLFEGSYVAEAGVSDYDVARDGQRFLMIKPEPPGSMPIEPTVVQNWFEELKRLVPAK